MNSSPRRALFNLPWCSRVRSTWSLRLATSCPAGPASSRSLASVGSYTPSASAEQHLEQRRTAPAAGASPCSTGPAGSSPGRRRCRRGRARPRPAAAGSRGGSRWTGRCMPWSSSMTSTRASAQPRLDGPAAELVLQVGRLAVARRPVRGGLADVDDGQAVQVPRAGSCGRTGRSSRAISAAHAPPPRRVRRRRSSRSVSIRPSSRSSSSRWPAGGRPRGASARRGGVVRRGGARRRMGVGAWCGSSGEVTSALAPAGQIQQGPGADGHCVGYTRFDYGCANCGLSLGLS